MVKNNNKINNFIMILLFLLSGLVILCYFHTATTFDEKYTLLLINHKFTNIISLDSLDVHPPLYYLILHYYLILTTSWTKSIIVKILFARLLSLIFSVITFIYICKIFKWYKLKFHICYEWILFILLPNVLNSYDPYTLEPLIDIRMYSLAAMIISIEFYNLINIKNNDSRCYRYILLIILSSMAMYTHYFAAIISVMLIITFIIEFILYNKKNIAKKLFISLIISIIMYIPWLPFLYKQINVPKIETFNMTRGDALVNILKFLVLCLIFSYSIVWSKYHLNNHINILVNEICITLGLTILFVSTFLLMIRPMFNLRYIYPIFIIYEMYALTIFFNYMKYKKKLIIIILIILLSTSGWSIYYQIDNISIPGLEIYRNIRNMNNKRIIKLKSQYNKPQIVPKVIGKNHQYDIDDSPVNFEYAFLLSYTNKYVYTYTDNLKSYFGINKKPAYKPLFKLVSSHILSKNNLQ